MKRSAWIVGWLLLLAVVPVLGSGPRLLLRAGAFDPLSEPAPLSPLAQKRLPPGEPGLRVVQFEGPIRDEWVDALCDSGLQVVTYLPDYAYLVWGDGDSVGRLMGRSPVRWQGDYQPQWALHPALSDSSRLGEAADITVQVFDGPGAEEVLRALETLSLAVIRPPQKVLVYRNVRLRLPSRLLLTVAALPRVVDVEPYLEPVRMDELQGQILAGALNGAGTQPSGPGYLAWLTGTPGFTTDPSQYPIVDVTDDGIDNGSATPLHADFYHLGNPSNSDRLIYNYNWTTDPTADGRAGHGNLNASIVAGYNADTGFPYEDG